MAKLNCQGLARRDKGVVGSILPDPGYVVVSSDASAGEPTVTTEFSKDKNYYDATFGMVGKEPFYEGGLLKIDDIYLTTMSTSPIGQKKMLEAFNSTYNGRSFVEQWMTDAEVIKKALDKDRKAHKILALGLSYGMGPKKMVKQMYDNGYNISLKEARDFFRSYWTTFRGVRSFADALAQQVELQGHIVNPFGYRLTPEPHKAFNYFIQSSVSGLFHCYTAKIFAAAPWAKFVTVIHDELLAEVPADRVEDFRKVIQAATDSLNEDLGWGVKLRFGFAPGTNWHEAK